MDMVYNKILYFIIIDDWLVSCKKIVEVGNVGLKERQKDFLRTRKNIVIKKVGYILGKD